MEIKRGKFGHLPVAPLLFDNCLLGKIAQGTSFTQYIYGSDKRIICEYSLATSQLYRIAFYHYKNGVIWPSTLNNEGQVHLYNDYFYFYDALGRVTSTKFNSRLGGAPPATEEEILYDAQGNIVNHKYITGGSMSPSLISIQYLGYDDKKNPYALLAKSMGRRPMVFSFNNVISSFSTVNYYTVTPYNTPQSTISYDYNPQGYPIKSVTNPGQSTLNYEYLGCK